MTLTDEQAAVVSAVPPSDPPVVILPLLALRAALGGLLMGLANLVPGISGGTMLVASGIYPHFLRAVAQATRLRFTGQSLLVLGIIACAAAVGIVGLAGVVGRLVLEQTWIMYSFFIGLTLGGVPVVWAMADKRDGAFWTGAGAGFICMAAIALVQMQSIGEGGGGSGGFLLMFVGGLLGAGAMILPGVSGGYLLLVLGVYVPILDGIDRARRAVQAGAFGDLADPVLSVILPVGVGVVLGIALVSNLLEKVLARSPRPTLGVLLGLLVGAVIGLWPFQQGVPPAPGDVIKGQAVTLAAGGPVFEKSRKPVEPKDYRRELYPPTAQHGAGGLALILVGLAVTGLVARLGRLGEGASESGAGGSTDPAGKR